MKANRAARHDEGGAEIIGALLLFGIFVSTIAILNVTAVPNAGRAAEQEHFERTLSTLNGLQSEAETAGLPGNAGSTVARSVDLAPARSVGQDFFSFFLATPARASGELTFERDYGNLSVFHLEKDDVGVKHFDIGSDTGRFPLGRLVFDPHPVFREPGAIQLENAAIVSSGEGGAAMRFDPPLSVSVVDKNTTVAIKARVLNGTDFSIGGNAPVRALLTTEAATLASPSDLNAYSVTMRITTDYGDAWEEMLDRISQDAGLVDGAEYTVEVDAVGDQDRVTWTLHGKQAATNVNDVRLTTGLAVYAVSIS